MIGVVGAGAMGGAMSVQLARAGHSVHLLATEFDGAFVEALRRGERHPALGARMPDDLTIVEQPQWEEVLPKAELLVLAVATAGLVPTVRATAHQTPGDCLWAVATKGWDEESLMPATGVVANELGDAKRVVAIVGPSIASEIAAGVPTAVVCASVSPDSARTVAEMFDSPHFRTYTSSDVVGVEVGAIMKNVVAIGVGMCDGLAEEFGVAEMTNAKAFVFSRGLVEMARLARALGGKAETILGLAGAGDLFVTALAGRNGKFGRLLGQGLTPAQALDKMKTTVEGYANARAAAALADKYDLELPVVDVIAKVIHYGLPPRDAIERLVSASVEEEL
ncbi:MAG: NAD(P)H-dependent glycerol-3-phosphate dehydrogenase [Actinomycetota bacterium]